MCSVVSGKKQALAQAHVPFEIIPGISSGIGGLAFAGIPITHRDYASGARLMSAHGKAGTMSDLDYAGMAHTRDTLIFDYGAATAVRNRIRTYAGRA